MGKKLPIGIQSIVKILEDDAYIYVDKTQYALSLLQHGAPNNFMSRPRRFGKSLFLSTLEEILKGNKDLFKHCYIYKSEYAWPKYSVLFFDFSTIAHETPQAFEQGLIEELHKKATEHDVSIQGSSLQSLLSSLVTSLGKVAILVDEYDKPIIDLLNTPAAAEANRTILKRFYTTLKSLDKHIYFSFMTGVSKFTQVSLFSGPNHVDDITLDDKYAQMMGYTKDDILFYFENSIQKLMEERSCSEDKILDELKEWYNGYCFAEDAQLVYNPFSTLLYFQKGKAQSYWFRSGTPSFLIDQVQKCPISALTLSQSIVSRHRLLNIDSIDDVDLPALLFQTGYLTIRESYVDDDAFLLDFPNREVRQAFFASLLEHFIQTASLSMDVKRDLEEGRVEAFINQVNQHFAKIPYQLFNNAKEGFFHAIFLTLLERWGLKTVSEMATNVGRIDLVTQTDKYIFIFELKVDKCASVALDQINTQKYFERFEDSSKEIVLVGINFSTTSRNIADWKEQSVAVSGMSN